MDKLITRPLERRGARATSGCPPMPHDVFISHSKDDKPTALALCNKLESKGVRCWIAPRDVTPGVEWGAAIIEAIEGSRVMVLIFSLKANNSKHVHREVHRAFAKNLTVIPVRVENARPTGTLEYYLGSVHWLDAMTPPLEKHLEIVAKQVKALLLPESVIETATRLAAQSPPAASQSTNPPTDVPRPVTPKSSEARADPDIPPSPPRPPSALPASSATKTPPVSRERKLGVEIPHTPSQTTNQPTDLRVRAKVKASSAQSERSDNLQPSPPTAPRSARTSSPTHGSPSLWEQIAWTIDSFISSGHPVQWKGILVSVVVLGVLNVVVAGMLKQVGSGAPALLAFVFLMGLVLLQLSVFFRIGCGATEKRWRHLLAVAIGAWLILSGVYAISDLGGLGEWGLLVLGIWLSMGSGGALAIFAKRSHEKKPSPLTILAAGVGLLAIIYVVLAIVFAATRKEYVPPLDDQPIERHGRPPR
jgi:hypothetical protein